MVRSRCERCVSAIVPMYAEPCVTCAEMPIEDDLFEAKVIYTLQPTNVKDDGCCNCITIDDSFDHFGVRIQNVT